MGDISKDFNRSEFACKCKCGFDAINPDLIDIVQQIRDHFGRPISVESGCRCSKRNKAVGGAKHSQHVLGNAADIKIKGVAPKAIAAYADFILGDRGGVKPYPTFCHVDVRDGFWRG